MRTHYRFVVLPITLMAMPVAGGPSALGAYDAQSYEPRRDADEVVKSSQKMSPDETRRSSNPYALVDLSNGLLPDDVPRELLLQDKASCFKMIALLKKQAEKLEKRSKGAQWVSFHSADHLQLESSIGSSLRLFRIFECEERKLRIGSYVETPQVPPPPPPPPPPLPDS